MEMYRFSKKWNMAENVIRYEIWKSLRSTTSVWNIFLYGKHLKLYLPMCCIVCNNTIVRVKSTDKTGNNRTNMTSCQTLAVPQTVGKFEASNPWAILLKYCLSKQQATKKPVRFMVPRSSVSVPWQIDAGLSCSLLCKATSSNVDWIVRSFKMNRSKIILTYIFVTGN